MLNLNSKTLNVSLLAFAAIAITIACSGPIWDMDFWWHLSSGRFFVEHRAFMQGDPFTFPVNSEDITSNPVINGYWLGQVILYSTYRVAGYYGIIFLRVLFILSALFSGFLLAGKLGSSRLNATVLFAASGLVFVNFTGERPQLFSFLLAPVIYMLIEDLREGCRNDRVPWKPACAMIILMLIWPSLHRGFLI